MGHTGQQTPEENAAAATQDVQDDPSGSKTESHSDHQHTSHGTGKTEPGQKSKFRSGLFTPLKIGNLSLTHRVVLAPLTRMRSSPEGVPNVELSPKYYQQRATKGGLLIAEATNISQQALGYPGTPGIFTDAHVQAWKHITGAVKQKGGHFFLQLWHVGRVSHSKLQASGDLPVAPSAVAIPGEHIGGLMFEEPHELRADDEIPAIVEDYRRATRNAFLAGFDGVEIHAANGYLIDQFLHNGSNLRTDRYGGSIANRSRFLLEVLSAVQAEWKLAVGPSSPRAGNVGVRLGPFGTFNNMSDSNEADLFRYVFTKLNDYHLAYIHVIQPRVRGTDTIGDTAADEQVQTLIKLFNGPVITAGGYTPDSGNQVVVEGAKSTPPREFAVAYGRTFIANPDLPLRIFLGAPTNHYNRATFYTPGPVGYTDLPQLNEEEKHSHVQALSGRFPDNQQLQRDIKNYVQLLSH